jgi:hypothetical protein
VSYRAISVELMFGNAIRETYGLDGEQFAASNGSDQRGVTFRAQEEAALIRHIRGIHILGGGDRLRG